MGGLGCIMGGLSYIMGGLGYIMGGLGCIRDYGMLMLSQYFPN